MNQTKKAVILAAGMGTRLKPLTLSAHKCLTKINGISILENALNQLSDTGVCETILVIGYLGNDIRNKIGNRYQDMNIHYVINDQYQKTNTSYSLLLGLQNVQDCDKLYLLEGDVFFEKNLLRLLAESEYENAALVEKYQYFLDGTFVERNEKGFVTDWTHKSMREEGYVLEDKYKTVNIYRFSRKFVRNKLLPKVNEINNKTNGQAPLENVMREIVKEDAFAVYGLESDGRKWMEIDDLKDLMTAEKLFRKE